MASQSSLGPVKSKPWQACFLLIRLFWWDSRDPRPSEATYSNVKEILSTLKLVCEVTGDAVQKLMPV